MPTIYKLTDQDMHTYGGCQWALGETKTTSGDGDLCGPGWLHCYTSPLLAVFLNPIHADIANPRLFCGTGQGARLDDYGLKCGFSEMTLLEELPVPTISTAQCVRFAILCAKQVCSDPAWTTWADAWLSGGDRSREAAARAAATAARAAATARAARAARASFCWVAGSKPPWA